MSDLYAVSDEFDKPWKVALERYLPDFLQLCFPAVHTLIDWRQPAQFLDTELQQLGPEHAQGARSVDRLVKVRLLDGREEWLFIHVEVQAQRESQFPQRMWIYYYRIWDKYGQRVVSLAVLADDEPSWRPCAHETATAGCRLLFEFPTFKVLDFTDAEGVFARTGNPFALLIAAHQMALATKRNPERRYERRFRLLRCLSELGMERQQARELSTLIQTLTRLPADLELKFKAATATVEHMTIHDLITPLQEIEMQQAEARGRRGGILDTLEVRFGTVPADLRVRVEQITDLARLRQIHRLAVAEPSLEQFLAKL